MEFEKMFLEGNIFVLDAIYKDIPLDGKKIFKSYKREINEMVQKDLKTLNIYLNFIMKLKIFRNKILN